MTIIRKGRNRLQRMDRPESWWPRSPRCWAACRRRRGDRLLLNRLRVSLRLFGSEGWGKKSGGLNLPLSLRGPASLPNPVRFRRTSIFPVETKTCDSGKCRPCERARPRSVCPARNHPHRLPARLLVPPSTVLTDWWSWFLPSPEQYFMRSLFY